MGGLISVLMQKLHQVKEQAALNASKLQESEAALKQSEAQYQQIQIQLQKADERFQLAASAANCLIYDWDIQQNIVYRTQGLAQVIGYDPQEVDQTSSWWRERIHPEDQKQLQSENSRLLTNSEVEKFQTEYRVLHKQGSYIYVCDRGIITRDDQGQAIRIVGLTLDINDQKQAEMALRESLKREQAARADAESANRIKDEFLAVLSHELRSPLNPILGWSKLLQNGNLNAATTTRALETIERNAKLQTQLIDDLLDVSRILRGKLRLNVCPVNLEETIEAALETVQLAAQTKSIQIQKVFEPSVGLVLGDSGRLQQVIWNLLTNAVKFTPHGGKVEVRLFRVGNGEEDKGDKADKEDNQKTEELHSLLSTPYSLLQISDTGKGINPEFLPHVFDYFRQENSATTRAFGGLGLGLAIVHHLVELHGGRVCAESLGENQGATFTVMLPLMPVDTQINLDDEQSNCSVDLKNLRILVVDDQADMREFLGFLLEEYGAQVTIAKSADEALSTLAQFSPNLLISDIGMPEMDGLMLMQKIRAMSPEQGGDIPAIALSAYAGETDHQQALAAGFQMHLAKPIEPTTLVTEVINLLETYPRQKLMGTAGTSLKGLTNN